MVRKLCDSVASGKLEPLVILYLYLYDEYTNLGNSYRHKKKGVIEFDGWKLLKRQGLKKRGKFGAVCKF